MELLVVLGIISLFLVYSILFFHHYEKIFSSHEKIVTDNAKIFSETLRMIQIKNFESAEKQTSKMLVQMDREQKELLKFFKSEETIIKEGPVSEFVKNDIETGKADEDIPMTEDARIPIIDGMKVQFEDEEEILPISIEGMKIN